MRRSVCEQLNCRGLSFFEPLDYSTESRAVVQHCIKCTTLFGGAPFPFGNGWFLYDSLYAAQFFNINHVLWLSGGAVHFQQGFQSYNPC